MTVRLTILFGVYAIIVISLGRANRAGSLPPKVIRKAVHLLTGLAIFALTYLVDERAMLILLGAGTLFALASYFVRGANYIHTTHPTSLGTLFFPIGLLSAHVVLAGMPVAYFRIVVLLLSISDTIASLGALRGRGNPRFSVPVEFKSVWGTIGFVLSGAAILALLLPGEMGARIPYALAAILIATHLELVSFRGSDNLSVPLGMALFFRLTGGSLDRPLVLVAVVAITASGSIYLVRKGMLTKWAGIAVHALGIYYFFVLGMRWATPVLLFFFAALVLTKINGARNRRNASSNRRNVWQVAANVIVATACSALYLATGNALFAELFVVCIAAVAADTWASEVGPLFPDATYSLRTHSRIVAGEPGGVSFSGSLASVAGAFLVAAVGVWMLGAILEPASTVAIAITALLAAFVDSLLSAFWEPRLLRLGFFSRGAGGDTGAADGTGAAADAGAASDDRLSANDVVNVTATVAAAVVLVGIRAIAG